MRTALLVIFCALSLSASAQFWKKKKKPEPEPVIIKVDVPDLCYLPDIQIPNIQKNAPVIDVTPFKRSLRALHIAQEEVMKDAKHDMRYNQFRAASYDFSDLAGLYILENRFSEAKWYLLQSNDLAKQLKDDGHRIANLLTLAGLKISIGEMALAKTDLKEAHDLATASGLITDTSAIDKRVKDIELTGLAPQKEELKYAETAEAGTKHQ